MSFSAQDVKKLRDATNAGMMDCKRALEETGGDFDKAVTWLREKGIASAAKRADREANEGTIAAYVHMGGKIGVLVEVNCETDFVARTDEFQAFARDLCLQVCSAAPRWVGRDDVPQEAIDAEKAVYIAQAKDSGKPEKIQDKIAEGRLNKWYSQVCLLEQEFVKDPDVTIESLLQELSGKLGERMSIRRFARFQLGESIDA